MRGRSVHRARPSVRSRTSNAAGPGRPARGLPGKMLRTPQASHTAQLGETAEPMPPGACQNGHKVGRPGWAVYLHQLIIAAGVDGVPGRALSRNAEQVRSKLGEDRVQARHGSPKIVVPRRDRSARAADPAARGMAVRINARRGRPRDRCRHTALRSSRRIVDHGAVLSAGVVVDRTGDR